MTTFFALPLHGLAAAVAVACIEVTLVVVDVETGIELTAVVVVATGIEVTLVVVTGITWLLSHSSSPDPDIVGERTIIVDVFWEKFPVLHRRVSQHTCSQDL